MTPTYQSMHKKGDGVSTSHDVRWLCGHIHRFGKYRTIPGLKTKTPWRCKDCDEAAKAAKEAK